MKKNYIFLIVIFVVTSCTTYYIPISSFKQQFAGIDSTKLRQVTVEGPIFGRYVYLANPVDLVFCVDKQGNPYQLINKPSLEIRFTYGHKKKRKVYYFDRIFVNSHYVIGVESRFIESIRSSIPLDSITKIEIQDGKKNFKYIY
jgi:hypothetical protein